MDTSNKTAAFGSLIGGKAIVPEKEKARQSAPVTQFASQPSHKANFLPPPTRHTATSVAPEPQVEESSVVGIGTAKALYDYPATDVDDLALTTGDIITILEYVSDDWWKGIIDGREGIFPANYVEAI